MDPSLLIGGLRTAIGVVAVGSPRTTAALFGVDPVHSPRFTYLSRLFGSREVVLGAAVLLARGDATRALVLAGAAIDAADAAAAAQAGREGALPRPVAGVLTVPGMVAAAVALGSLRRR